MSNQEQQTAQPDNTQTNAAQNLDGPGKQLAQARAAQGLTQQEVADRLHLRITSIQAVESDSLEQGVSVTFSKGYVRLYAKLLNMPPEPLLEAYNRLHAKENQPAKLQSFSRRVSREAHDHRWNMVSIVVFLLVAGSVVVWWVDREGYFRDSGKNISEAFDSLLSSENEDGTSDTEADLSVLDPDGSDGSDNYDNIVKQDAGPAILEEEAAGLASDVSEAIEQSDIVLDGIQDQASQALDAIDDGQDELNNVLDDPNSDDASPTVAPAPVASTTSNGRQADPSRGDIVEGVFTEDGYRINADGTVEVSFTFKDDCWVSVKDGDGEIMAIGVKTKGRVMVVSGIPPVSVILGAPQSVEIDFGGLAVDMSVYPGGESARFTLPVAGE